MSHKWNLVFLAAVLSGPSVLCGQVRTSSDHMPIRDEATIGAEREADRLVSLSANRVIDTLQNEPGLLLQVKRLLVKKAYAQGRLLDPQDLTDEALFRLIREDDTIRVLATREIQERFYVRAKPNREERDELARDAAREPRRTGSDSSQGDQQNPLRVRQNQEDSYWLQHDQQSGDAAPLNSVPSSEPPNYYAPSSPPLESQPRSDSRRQLDRAQAQFPQDQLDGGPVNGMDMPRVNPEDLPELLHASALDGSFSGLTQRSDRTDFGPTRALPESRVERGSAQPGFGENQISQQTRLDSRSGPPLPPLRSSLSRDEPVARHRPNPYADVPALYDMYSQYSKRPPLLERFGEDVFRNGSGNVDELPMDLPVGPDYVVGPGDGLSIQMWGSVSQRLQRVVDREGRVALPDVGAIDVSGRSLGEVQHLVQATLRTEYRQIDADVSLSRLRTVRVYVVGDVERPGAYDVSSLSTPLNALYIARGPTSRGSLRRLQHYRGKRLVQEVDVYDLLLHGIRSGLDRLESGDTLLVPPLGAEVTIQGMVRRPAVYELNGEKSLSEVLELAGGVLPTGTLRQVDVERLEAHDHRTMLHVSLAENNNQEAINRALDDFQVQDNDTIRISPILPYTDKTVYLDGHVFRPGKYAYRDGMKVTDLIKSYNELLPEPYKSHAEVIRLNPPDFTPTVLAFNLDDALAGKEQDLVLKAFDTVRVFGRYDFEDPPVITVTGEIRDPGDHVTNGVARLTDAIFLAGGATPDARLDDVQVFRKTPDGKLEVLNANLGKALAGDAEANILLAPKDRIVIHQDLAKLDPATVTIQGEVAQPGKYQLGSDMTAAGLVRAAGGLKRGAYTEEADLTRYQSEQRGTVAGEHLTVDIGQALATVPDTDVRLRDGDVLTIRQQTGWDNIGAMIAVKGAVLHPGTYGIQEGERLSSILSRAGGFRSDAYPYGVVFERVQVRDLEEQSRAQLIREVQDEGSGLKLTPETDDDQRMAKDASVLQWKSTLERLQNTPPTGRLVVHIASDIKRWANTPADIQVRAGDVIYVPKQPNFVMVNGAVYHPTAVTFKPGKSANWYLEQAGGPNNMANKKAVFVIRADGSVRGKSGGLFSGDALDTELEAGDVVVVPEKAFSGSPKWRNILQSAQLVSAVGIAVQVARGF